MRLLRAWLVSVLMLLSLGHAAADATTFSASSLHVVGESTVEGSAAALFALLDGASLEWEATAASVSIERFYANYSSVFSPFNPEQNAYTLYQDDIERIDVGAASIASGASRTGGAFLLLGRGAPQIDARTDELLLLSFAKDPVLAQWAEMEVSQDTATYVVHERLHGEYLNASLMGGTFEIRGDVEIQLSEIDYRLSWGDGEARALTTGFTDSWSAGAARQGRAERHVITLLDAVVRVRVADEAMLYTTDAILSVAGDVRANDAHGALLLGGDRVLDEQNPNNRVDGQLTLTTQGSHVSASDAAGLVAATRGAAPTAGFGPLWLVALALMALAGVVGIALYARRDRPDDVEAAILAIEERRWSDALPPLERAIAKRPQDASLRMDRALCLAETGQLAAAREMYQRLLREDPSAETHFYYARVLARQRDASAAAHLDRALALDPRLADLARADAALAAL